MNQAYQSKPVLVSAGQDTPRAEAFPGTRFFPAVFQGGAHSAHGDLPSVSLVKSLLNPIVVVLTLALCTRAYGIPFTGIYLMFAVLAFLISSQVFEQVDLFQSWRDFRFLKAGKKILLGWLTVVAILLFIAFATKLSAEFSRRVILTWFVFTPLALGVGQIFARVVLHRVICGEGVSRSAIIVGATELGRELARKVKEDPYLCLDVKGFFDDRKARPNNSSSDHVLGGLDDVAQYVQQHSVNQIYITLPMVSQPRIMNLLDQLRDTTSSIYFVPDIFMFDLIQARFIDINGIPAMAICETPFSGLKGVVKRLSDGIIASIVLYLIWPLMLFIAIGVKLSSPGPIIFKQRRYGLDGQEILVYKFRTMTVCEDDERIEQARQNDVRVTRFGKFLRKTSLDELPQFINVLEGKMSIVGPRPHAIAHNEMYRKLVKGYMIRHKVKPGITGWAQIHGFRGETDTIEKMRKRIEYDLDYLRNWSLWLDLWIAFKTIFVVLKRSNAY